MTAEEFRRRWRWLVLAYVILAGFVVGGLIWNQVQQHTLQQHQNVLKVELRQSLETQRALKRLTLTTAASLCLLAVAPTNEERFALVETFVKTGKVTVDGNALCRRAVAEAARLILVDH